MVVVVNEADQLTMNELDSEFARLAAAAQTRTATLEELTGRRFSQLDQEYHEFLQQLAPTNANLLPTKPNHQGESE